MEPIVAIDVHGHYGTYYGAVNSVGDEFMSASGETIAPCGAAKENIQYTIVSPLEALLPRGKGNTLKGNADAVLAVEQVPGLLQYVVINPR